MWSQRRDIPTDIEDVLSASAALDISEVELFREAYRKWFGEPLSERRLDRHFVAYMFAGVVPHWVRDYSRQVVQSAQEHRLDPVRFGVLPKLRRHYRKGFTLLLLPALILLVLVLTSHWTLQYIPQWRGCLLPPCY